MQLDLGWYVFRRLPFPSIFSPVVIEANQTSGVTPKQGRRVGTRKAKEVGEKWGQWGIRVSPKRPNPRGGRLI